ncbi:hypothetical protein JTY93_20950 [Pseudomonas hygromyciniae]|uniref:Phage tail protein n=1 Tax=Pseudomonas hygromyciniae TaxID=2812000 RepID=A0ABX7JYA0_9PSED|nr:hypothetical protein [Pseudomonas hygromyciniae]MBN0976961.1 hypothetical protein [Pseudomonas hygromyciniae]QSB38691.1 hypothetical protein JTY93_20950 [Pseudomonas hygromyciniae]
MSMETTIASLVAAANKLTSVVNGKVAEIDASVLAAVRAIPDMSRLLHVDAIAGSDLALGTVEAPIKTIKEAMSRTKTTPFVMIALKAGQTHEYAAPTDQTPYWSVSNKLVFYKYGGGSNPVFYPKVGEYMAGRSNIHFLSLEGGSVYFRSVDVVMPTVLKAETSDWYSFGSSLFYRAHGADSSVQGSVTFSGNKVKLGALNIFHSGYSANYRVDLTYSVVDAELSTKFADLSGGTMVLSVFASSITQNRTWAHLVGGVVKDSGGSLSNLLSNVGNVVAAGV